MTETFNDLYLHELELLASAEQQMIDLLGQLAGGTDTEELRRAFQRQGDSCTEQRSVVIALIKEVGGKARVSLGHGMKGLINECLVLLKEFPTGNLRDAVMIAHMQRAEHYKMDAYTSVRDYAKLLGKKEAVASLNHALKLTTGASKDLGSIAIQINAEPMSIPVSRESKNLITSNHPHLSANPHSRSLRVQEAATSEDGPMRFSPWCCEHVNGPVLVNDAL